MRMLSTKRSAIAAAGGFSVIAAFQLALALGAPFGRAAWGGRYSTLPAGVRFASLVSMGVYLLFGWLILARGRVRRSDISGLVVNRGTWVIVVLLSLGTVLNLASQSKWERYCWAPFAAILAVLSTKVARSPRLDSFGADRRSMADPISDGPTQIRTSGDDSEMRFRDP